MDIMIQDDEFTCRVSFLLPLPDLSQIWVNVTDVGTKNPEHFYFLGQGGRKEKRVFVTDKISDPFHVQHQAPYCPLRKS